MYRGKEIATHIHCVTNSEPIYEIGDELRQLDATYILKSVIDCVALAGAIASFYYVGDIAIFIKGLFV